MKLSIIIPTHNRAESLKRAMESIVSLRDEVDFEFVIVDNNSTDNTKKVTENYSRIARYVFEGNTSFTKARGTGAENAAGDIFLYLDDDVIIHPGSLRKIVSIFGQYKDCGVIAGKILPQYEDVPPDWALACQRSFNAWSLYNPETILHLGTGFQEVNWAAGPMMAIRRDAYEKVGGFPPDTIGVETNSQAGTFRKLYVGPGDYGICHRIQKAGYKVYYSPDVSCYHVVLKARFTVPFWRSRMIGEAHHKAITNREFYNLSYWQLWQERMKAKLNFEAWMKRLCQRLKSNATYSLQTNFRGMFFEELWLHYFEAYIKMDTVLNKNPDLSGFLWGIGLKGVANGQFEKVVGQFPPEYLKLIDSERVYCETPITSIDEFESFGFSSPENEASALEHFGYSLLRLASVGKRVIAKFKNSRSSCCN